MEIKEYTIKELKKAIIDNSLWNNDVIPITKHRAISYINNPNCSDDDFVLAVASENGKIIGYRCILPDIININGVSHKFGWTSTTWVEPNLRGKGIGKSLSKLAFDKYNNRLASSYSTHKAVGIYKSINQVKELSLIQNNSYFLHSYFSTSGIIKKISNKFLSNIVKVPLTIIDTFINEFLQVKQNSYIQKHLKNTIFIFEYLFQLDKESKEFIKKNKKNEYFNRTPEFLNWILKYPWVLNAPLKDINQEKYYFSSVCSSMDFYCLKIRDNQMNIIGVLIIKQLDEVLSIPYLYYKNEHLRSIVLVILKHAIELKTKSIYVGNKDIIYLLDKINFPFFRVRKDKSRLYLVPKTFNTKEIEKYYFQDGDGDLAFT